MAVAVTVVTSACVGIGAVAITNVTGVSGMEYAALDGGIAPLCMAAPKQRPGKAAEWFSCGGDPSYYTNSAGARISAEEYYGICKEDGWAAFKLFGDKYNRCRAEMSLRLAELDSGEKCRCHAGWKDPLVATRDGGGRFETRKIGDELYLVYDWCRYSFVLFDGVTFRRLVQFESEPSDEQMGNIVLARTNPSALNNLAVMIDKGEAVRDEVRDEYVERLLQIAASGNEPAACRNLARYYRRKGDSARSEVWTQTAETVSRRVAAGAKKKLERRPLSEWPLMRGAPQGGGAADLDTLVGKAVESALSSLDGTGDADDCYEEEKQVESWLDTFRVKYWYAITSELPVFYLDGGNKNELFHSDLQVTRDKVYSRCWMEQVIPPKRLKAVSDFIKAYNATHSVVTMHTEDWSDEGTSVYFRYVTPTSVLRRDKFDPVVKECFNRMLDLPPLVAAEQIPELMRIVRGE